MDGITSDGPKAAPELSERSAAPWAGVPAQVDGAVPAFPAELWGRAAPWLLPRDFARLCQCARQLVFSKEKNRLWRSFCHAEEYACAPEGGFSIDVEPSERWWQGPQVDWQSSFRVNAEADASVDSHTFTRVLVRDVELRVPLAVDEGDDRRASPQRKWLCKHGWRTVACLSNAVQRMLVPCGTALRFRELFAGRPGALLRRALFHASSGPTSAMLEWPIGRTVDGAWCWRLPPYKDEREDDEGNDRGFVPGPRPWGHGKGWLLQLAVRRPELRQCWVCVGASQPASALTLGELCQELQQHLPVLGFAWDAQVQPAGVFDPLRPMESAQPHWRLHADLRWTQGERLCLVEAPEAAAAGCGGPGRGQSPLPTVLFQREAARGGAGRPRCLGADPAPAQVGCSAAGAEAAGAEAAGAEAAGTQTAGTEAASRLARSGFDKQGRQGKDGGLDPLVPRETCPLLSSYGAQCFDFHPTRPATILAGWVNGVIAVLDSEADMQTHLLEADPSAIVGVAWLHTQPQWAVAGAAEVGALCLVRYDEDRRSRLERIDLDTFPDLCSLSVNCTDDYLVTGGLRADVGLCDVVTGQNLKSFCGLHKDSITGLSFAHRSPHLFASGSSDHTCKVWDLRVPINASRPVRLYNAGMSELTCCFSPDDGRLLCSGSSESPQEFRLEGVRDQMGCCLQPPPVSSYGAFRRSVYLADSSLAAMATGDQGLLRLYTAEAARRAPVHASRRGMPLEHRCTWASPSDGLTAAGVPDDFFRRSGVYEQDLGRGLAQGGGGYDSLRMLRGHPLDPALLGAVFETSTVRPWSYIAMLPLRA